VAKVNLLGRGLTDSLKRMGFWFSCFDKHLKSAEKECIIKATTEQTGACKQAERKV